MEEVRQYYPRFSEKEYERRYKLIRKVMAQQNLDCLILYGQVGISGSWQANIHYVSNYADTHYHGYLIFPMEEEPTLLITIYPHVLNAKIISVVKDVRWAGWDPAATIVKRVKELKIEKKRIGLVGPGSFLGLGLPHDHYEKLTKGLPNASFEDVTDLMEDIRSIKSQEEIEALEKGAEFTDMAMEGLVKAAKPGAKDYELAAAIMCAYLWKGGSYSFQLVGSTSMSNPVMPYPWKYPSSRTVQSGDIIMAEISACYNFYAGQLIRPIAIGKPTKEHQEIFEVALEAYKKIVEALRPGNTEKDVLKATAPIEEAGLKIHAPVVHGWAVGISKPFVGIPGSAEWPVRRVEFKAGMTVMVEPNPVTPDGKRGMFLGSLHAITDSGARCLQKYPVEFIAI